MTRFFFFRKICMTMSLTSARRNKLLTFGWGFLKLALFSRCTIKTRQPTAYGPEESRFMQDKNPAFFLLILCLFLLFPLAACSSKPSLEQEAERFAREYWETFITRCPDSYVMKQSTWYAHGAIGYQGQTPPQVLRRSAPPPAPTPSPRPSFAEETSNPQPPSQKPFEDDGRFLPEAIYQYHFVDIKVEKEAITDFTDQLIQTEFKGTTTFAFKSSRFYSPTKQTWSDWEDNTDKRFKARIFKHEGRWEIYGVNTEIIRRDKLKTVFKNVEPVDCGNLPQ
jgi:hypothetical protein